MTCINDVLPPEVVDYSIDFLHDDKRSLVNASLVCKLWFLCSRYHLFAVVRVKPPTKESTLISTFIQFLIATPRVACLIRSLYLVKPVSLAKSALVINPDSLISILSCLDSLEAVCLDGVICRGRHTISPTWNTDPTRLLKVLKLQRVFLMEPGDNGAQALLELLHIFSCIRIAHLFVLQVWWDVSSVYKDPADEVPVIMGDDDYRFSVNACTLQATAASFYCEFLEKTVVPEPFRSLNIPTMEASDIPYVSTILKTVGPHIYHLRLDISEFQPAFEEYDEDESDRSIDPLNIRYCTSLKSLHLIVPGDCRHPTTGANWKAAERLLRSVNPTYLERISIGFKPSRNTPTMEAFVHAGNWAEWDSILCSPTRKFSRLLHVEFLSCRREYGKISLDCTFDHEKAVIESTLPRLQKEGKLLFHY